MTFSRVNFQRQAEAGECGLACLAMIASHHGLRLGLSELRRHFPLTARGASIKTLIKIADEIGFQTSALRCDLKGLEHLQPPAMLHWDLNHFVVLTRVRRRRGGLTFEIADPAKGMNTLGEEEFSKHFTGVVLDLETTAGFRRRDPPPSLRLPQLWSKLRGLFPALAKLLTLSLIMQIVALTTPFYMQTTIDSVVPAQDLDLGKALLLGFAGLWIINTGSSILRSLLVIDLTNSLSLQMAVNLFRHTIFLPISWYEKRHLGDVISRFGSLQPITDLLSRGLVAAVVDGFLSVATLALMLMYSPLLSAISCAAIALFIATKIAFYNTAKLANASVLSAQAAESSAFIESIRGIETIKVFCQEENRQRIWRNKKAEVVRTSLKMGQYSASFDVVNVAILGFEALLFVYIASHLIIEGAMTIGMVFAYQAYKQSFVGSITRLVDQVVNYKLLDVHLDRISDIAFAEPEAALPPRLGQHHQGLKSISLRGISFRYGRDTPLILENLDLDIEAGTTTAIVGPSGVGKSTLLKVLCCLLEPQGGTSSIDGQLIGAYGVRRLRNQLGVVSQDDSLFAGSLADNIAFFEADIDQDWLIECCRKAAIHEDIVKMPMGYDTSVGDMGSNLSGGQKQRVLLARALYKRPSMLVIDEGTSHLDIATEAIVAASVRSLGITRVIVAHRPETVRLADRVLAFVDRRLIDITAMNNTSPIADTATRL
ncbi:peptidase domain-containing ABC transporter [Variovorax saccharolyticus]|uniref:peptidase domain-containing ABC transporter n=1 Tax=Variovorax saccharolyticus TaxID=3053516 RepID=UPI0025789765|nr:peptidase domain-containing ABC transporter [Variovorax sp. J31P216]MDM0029169.1 peptidase domain-containing ABC transporter [Variovorax sp. J31P216]